MNVRSFVKRPIKILCLLGVGCVAIAIPTNTNHAITSSGNIKKKGD